MRILFVSVIDAYWGGSEVLWSLTSATLAKEGHKVAAYFGYYKPIPPILRLQERGVSLYFGTPEPKRWWKRLIEPRSQGPEAFKHALAEFRPDIVVFSQAGVKDGIQEARLCRELNVRYAIINQLIELLFYDAKEWRAIRDLYLNATKVWFVSTENRERLENWLGASLSNASVVNNATGKSADPLPDWPDETRGLKLACVGRLYAGQKGQDLLIDALADPKWSNRQLSLTFFGDGEREILEARIKFRKASHIRFAGYVSHLGEIWREHHALVLPSRYEGQSLAMLEAMLHARPVFVTPVDGTRGLVRDNHNGFVAKSIDLEGVRDLLERAWSKRAIWRELGKAAQESALAWVDTDPGEAMADRIKALLA